MLIRYLHSVCEVLLVPPYPEDSTGVSIYPRSGWLRKQETQRRASMKHQYVQVDW